MIDMKYGIELYVRFALDQREFRFFAPVTFGQIVGEMETSSMIASRNLHTFVMADIIVNLGNNTLLKNRYPEFELSDETIGYIKSIPLTDFDKVTAYAKQQTDPTIIGEFRGEYRFLSNFAPAEFVYQDILWPNSEAAYQAMKSHDRAVHLEFARFTNPAHAKRAGRLINPMRADWDEVKVAIMRSIVSAKFVQNPGLKQKLIDTGSMILQEGNMHNDRTWGVCPPYSGKGENHLGKILMDVRRELKTISF